MTNELRYARVYRSNLVNLRYALENAQELAECCGQMGEGIRDGLQTMIDETRNKVRSIDKLLAGGGTSK